MLSFLQFTRCTLWREFAWVGAIIFERNFMLRGQFSGGGRQFSSEAIIVWGNYLGGSNFPRGQLSGHHAPESVKYGIKFFTNYNLEKVKKVPSMC